MLAQLNNIDVPQVTLSSLSSSSSFLFLSGDDENEQSSDEGKGSVRNSHGAANEANESIPSQSHVESLEILVRQQSLVFLFCEIQTYHFHAVKYIFIHKDDGAGTLGKPHDSMPPVERHDGSPNHPGPVLAISTRQLTDDQLNSLMGAGTPLMFINGNLRIIERVEHPEDVPNTQNASRWQSMMNRARGVIDTMYNIDYTRCPGWPVYLLIPTFLFLALVFGDTL